MGQFEDACYFYGGYKHLCNYRFPNYSQPSGTATMIISWTKMLMKSQKARVRVEYSQNLLHLLCHTQGTRTPRRHISILISVAHCFKMFSIQNLTLKSLTSMAVNHLAWHCFLMKTTWIWLTLYLTWRSTQFLSDIKMLILVNPLLLIEGCQAGRTCFTMQSWLVIATMNTVSRTSFRCARLSAKCLLCAWWAQS